jgi:hypothetical protein
MTDRLSALLHEEAQHLTVPPADAADVLARGRGLRRKRRLAQGLTIVAVVAVVGVGAAFAFGGSPDRTTEDLATDPGPDAPTSLGIPADVGYVFASGNTVYLRDGTVRAQMDEVAQTLYYTSAGLLVRTNATGNSDGGAPFHFALVTGDGTVTKLALTLGEVVPTTDPRQPYVAYAEADGGEVRVVVRDVTTDQVVASVDVPGLSDWGGWEAPPVSLDSDDVYVGTSSGAVVVNWRTGEVTTSDVLPPGPPDVRSGRTVVSDDGETTVVDATTGASVFTVPSPGKYDPWVRLAPDGRSVTALDLGQGQPKGGLDWYAVDTGAHATLPGDPSTYGWDATGDAYSVTQDGITECLAAGHMCRTTPLPEGVRLDDAVYFVRLGGVVYES